MRAIPHTWIPLADGTRISARLWFPEGSDDEPVPAVLEYLPYRKGDLVASRDAAIASYHAMHGYAYVRVDIRGTGDSEGIITDEYTLQEQDDALELIAWMAAQSWCSGAVGMVGISWGGFNGLQVAARRPAALKAVISMCSTDDRYADDVHYDGGCVLGIEMMPWAASMLSFDSLPPDPATVGEVWRTVWLDRLERTPPMIDAWLGHQRRDAYWKHGSVCEDYAAIECPVYMVGGWADGYTNAIPRTLAGLPGVRRGLIGPWPHAWPHDAAPGPSIGFLQEALRWWNRWLKDEPNGIEDEPMLRAWIQESVAPGQQHLDRPGRWVTSTAWPPPEVELRRRYLGAGDLGETAGEEVPLSHRGLQHHGLAAGAWCPYGSATSFPGDQREEDALCLTFETDALFEPLELFGSPSLHLRVAADRPLASIAARLCEVAPDGTSLVLTRGALNLTHRESHEHPEALEPGKRYDVTIPLDVLGARVPGGHRLRLALSSTYWPWMWPSPDPVELTVVAGPSSWIDLPVRPATANDDPAPEFGEPEHGPQLATETEDEEPVCEVIHDRTSGTYTYVDRAGDSLECFVEDGLAIAYSDTFDRFTIREGDPLSARVDSERRITLSRGAWKVAVSTQSSMTADRTRFHLFDTLEAFEEGERVFTRSWDRSIPRDHT